MQPLGSNLSGLKGLADGEDDNLFPHLRPVKRPDDAPPTYSQHIPITFKEDEEVEEDWPPKALSMGQQILALWMGNLLFSVKHAFAVILYMFVL